MHAAILRSGRGVSPLPRTTLRGTAASSSTSRRPRHVRPLAFVVLLVCTFFGLTVFQTQDKAYAYDPTSITYGAVTLTRTAAAAATSIISGGGAAAGGAGVITGGGGGAGAAAAASGAAAVAVPSTLIVGAFFLGYGIGTTIRWGWKAATSTTYADPPAVPPAEHYGSYTATVTTSGGQSAAIGVLQGNFVTPSCSGCVYVSTGGTTLVTAQNGSVCTSASPCTHQLAGFASGVRARVYSAAATLESHRWASAATSTAVYLKVVAGDFLVVKDQNNFGPAGTTAINDYYQKVHLTGTAPPAVSPGTGVATTTPTSRCTNTTTGVPTNRVGSAINYTRLDPDSDLPVISIPDCNAGEVRTGVKFPTTNAAGTPIMPPVEEVWPTDPTTIVPSGYPQCQFTSGKSCVLVLTITSPSGQTATCNNTTICSGWTTLATPSGSPETQTKPDGTTQTVPRLAMPDGSELTCKFGPYVVPTDECKVVPTDAPPDDPEGDDKCYPSGWAALNPTEWVVKPLKCLFIPSDEAVQAAGESIAEAWSGTAPAVVADKVEDVAAPVVALGDDTGPTSCDGPAFVIPQLPTMDTPVTLHPLSTCNELTTYLLGIYMPIATALVYIGGFFAGTRVILKAFNLDTGEAV